MQRRPWHRPNNLGGLPECDTCSRLGGTFRRTQPNPGASASGIHGCKSALIRPFDRSISSNMARYSPRSSGRWDGDSEFSLSRIPEAEAPSTSKWSHAPRRFEAASRQCPRLRKLSADCYRMQDCVLEEPPHHKPQVVMSRRSQGCCGTVRQRDNSHGMRSHRRRVRSRIAPRGAGAVFCGNSSVGRALASQASCRGFESRFPLHTDGAASVTPTAVISLLRSNPS